MNKSKYLRISLTNKCNLNCYYCHNEGQDFKRNCHFSKNDILDVAKVAKSKGYTKVKLTGGEPTLRKDICEIIQGIKQLGFEDVSMITNGIKLGDMLPSLKEAGLDRINVSVNTIDLEKYVNLYGGNKDYLRQKINSLMALPMYGYTDSKVNFVYTGEDSKSDLEDLLELTRDTGSILVLLPIIDEENSISLSYLYSLLEGYGVAKEEVFEDAEGIRKTCVYLKNGSRVLLRLEELKDKKPYTFCIKCNNKSACREGIFPLRLTAEGLLAPCLVTDEHSIDLNNLKKDSYTKEDYISKLSEVFDFYSNSTITI